MPYWQTASAHFHPGLPRSSTDEHFVGGAQLGYIGEMNRAPIKPALMRWARERAGYGISDLTSKFPRLQAWENGTAQPTLRQVENFARATHTPVGYLFLSEPPKETVPIPDFRSMASSRRDHPSPNLLETIYICQQRQAWYRDHAIATHLPRLAFVGSLSVATEIRAAAEQIRTVLDYETDQQRTAATWTDALRSFIQHADDSGILVMSSGVVGTNNHRRLDPNEFRGFALVDDLAPVIFVNGADTKAAQMFTLAHELAHIWLGQSALSDVQPQITPDNQIEHWCNRLAAELLVPISLLQAEIADSSTDPLDVEQLARRFKVSTLVVLRRVHDAGAIDRGSFLSAYDAELERILALPKGSGGSFYLTQAARVSKRFARALVESTLEGRTSFTASFRMLGIKKTETFHKLGESLGVG